jgi:bifunctional oligoribonuclease and PAP phosphatase NrnA
MSSFIYKQIKGEIERANNILLLTDERIDGDTMGSTLGMFHILKDSGKQVQIFSPKPLHESLSFLPGAEMIRRDGDIFEEEGIDLVMIFDCSDGEYIKSFLPRMKEKVPLIVFDHHATNPKYGDINLIEDRAASTADVVWRFVKSAGLKMNKKAAQCILTGICTDTSAFSTSNTTAACMDAAHELARYGAKLQEIVRHTMMNKSIPSLKLWGLAFERLHRNDQFDAVATAIKRKDLKQCQAQQDDLEGLSNFLNAMVEGAETIMVMYEKEGGSVKGSLRSRTRNVAKLAQKYGGGGHVRASGFDIEKATLEEKDGQWFIRKVGGEIVVK